MIVSSSDRKGTAREPHCKKCVCLHLWHTECTINNCQVCETQGRHTITPKHWWWPPPVQTQQDSKIAGVLCVLAYFKLLPISIATDVCQIKCRAVGRCKCRCWWWYRFWLCCRRRNRKGDLSSLDHFRLISVGRRRGGPFFCRQWK